MPPKSISSKKSLGQFYTTNYEYILQNVFIPDNVVNIIEPFAGNGDLLKFIEKNKYTVECYDIDAKHDYIIQQDTLLNPPILNEKFVITNPPYLARNKSDDKEMFNKYNTNDLYKCFIQLLIQSNCLGGIIIVPLNFICSIRKSDVELREQFIAKYDIIIINVFEEQVFVDTTYTICCFQFEPKKSVSKGEENEINCYVYPSKSKIKFTLNSSNNYTLGGEIYNLQQTSFYKIDRATRMFESRTNFTNVVVKCIDDSSTNQIRLFLVKTDEMDKYIDHTLKLSSRSYALLIIEPPISIKKQEMLIGKFNEFITLHREKYNSLFLTNYRENSRKRISFGLVYEICNYLLTQIE